MCAGGFAGFKTSRLLRIPDVGGDHMKLARECRVLILVLQVKIDLCDLRRVPISLEAGKEVTLQTFWNCQRNLAGCIAGHNVARKSLEG